MALNRHTAARPAPRRAHRRGMASIEVVMTAAIMVPAAAAILWLCIKIATIVYQVMGALVAWPFL